MPPPRQRRKDSPHRREILDLTLSAFTRIGNPDRPGETKLQPPRTSHCTSGGPVALQPHSAGVTAASCFRGHHIDADGTCRAGAGRAGTDWRQAVRTAYLLWTSAAGAGENVRQTGGGEDHRFEPLAWNMIFCETSTTPNLRYWVLVNTQPQRTASKGNHRYVMRILGRGAERQGGSWTISSTRKALPVIATAQQMQRRAWLVSYSTSAIGPVGSTVVAALASRDYSGSGSNPWIQEDLGLFAVAS